MNLTDAQKAVIDARKEDLLVSASAGSGKTSVLVQRILSLITQDEDPVDIDRFLVVTFTRSAAAEMRERLRKALDALLAEDPFNARLLRQSTLIHTAQITTIDGFCSYVLRNYGTLLGMESSFRVAEEGEVTLLSEKVLEDLLEEEYEKASPDFLSFVETAAPGNTAGVIESLILRMFRQSSVSADPEAFFSHALDDTRLETAEDLFRTEWMREDLRYADDIAREGLEKALAAEDLLKDLGEWENHGTLAMGDTDFFRAFLEAEDIYPDKMDVFSKHPFARFNWRLKKGEDPSGKELYKKQRDAVKKLHDDIRTLCFTDSPEGILASAKAASSIYPELIRLTKRFTELFSERKRENGIVDFGDLETLTLRVLRDGKGDPTPAARELSDRFVHIFIDEYQDSNYLQEAILTAVSRSGRGEPNYFMVGDVKQSIYSFRQAEPRLFMEKYKQFSSVPRSGAGRRINLTDNFRSRKEILSSVNAVFSRIMQKSCGGIDYDEEQYLTGGQPEIPDASKGPVTCLDGSERTLSPVTECLITYEQKSDSSADSGDGLSDPSASSPDPSAAYSDPEKDHEDGKEDELFSPLAIKKREDEAVRIGLRIGEMVRNECIYDTEKKGYRPILYRDIVILLRSIEGWSDVFSHVLSSRFGIPVYTDQRTGYFSAWEVRIVLSFLRILDNPRQDIHLSAVLHSPIGGLTADDLARVRLCLPGREYMFWDCVLACAETGEDPALLAKIRHFLRLYDDLRLRSSDTPVEELLPLLYEKTGFYAFAAAMPDGARRAANLEMLIERAVSYSETSLSGLYHFIRYIEELNKYNVDYGEAESTGEGENAVRILTVHKSKGLQYPIVFAAGLSKRFNTKDLREKVLLDPVWGIAADHFDPVTRILTPSLKKAQLVRHKKADLIGEEIRILYVAMTRAQEKLVLSFTAKEDEICRELFSGSETESPVPASVIREARAVSDLLVPALARTERGIFEISASAPGPEEEKDTVPSFEEAEIPENAGDSPADPARILYYETLYRERFAYRYPYEASAPIPAKVSVSELKAAHYYDEEAFSAYEEAPVIPLIPAFLRDTQKDMTGADRGTAYHALMERISYALPAFTEDTVRDEIRRLTEEGHLESVQAAAIRVPDIVRFLCSPLGARMAQAASRGDLHREVPFTTQISASQADPAFPEEETVLVQGVIDAWFYEDGKIVLVDYKTDRVRPGEEEKLVRKYRIQLDLYADALSRLTGVPCAEQYIYSFALSESIPLADL